MSSDAHIINDNKLPTTPNVPQEIMSLCDTDDTPTTKKDIALVKAGATREVAYNTMVAGLSARSMTVDKFGEEHWADDHTSRLRAAEMISKLNGDLKDVASFDNRSITINIGNEVMVDLLHMVKDVASQLVALRTSGQQTGEIIDVQAS
jgi:hypothetical protein